MLLERSILPAVEIMVITFWRSSDAIRRFAGADLDEAVVAEEAVGLLTQFDRRVRHYEVVVKEDTRAFHVCGLGANLFSTSV